MLQFRKNEVRSKIMAAFSFQFTSNQLFPFHSWSPVPGRCRQSISSSSESPRYTPSVWFLVPVKQIIQTADSCTLLICTSYDDLIEVRLIFP